jgi:KaiC/GvpD/RAD55 family RecA-like ATPase
MSRDFLRQARAIFEPGDIVEMRLLGPGEPIKRWRPAADLPSMTDELAEYNRQGWNIYFGPNPRKARNLSGDKNVLLSRCLFADFDHIEADGCGPAEIVLGRIEDAGLPTPSLIANSGHGIHAYWRLAGPVTGLDRWRILQKRLIATVGSDPAIHNPERIMRAAGFENTKREPHAPAFIVQAGGGVYSLDEIEPHLKELSADLPVNTAAPVTRPVGTDRREVIARATLYTKTFEAVGEGDRNNAAFRYAARLREKFIDLDEADVFDLLRNVWGSDLPDAELRTVIRDAFRYGRKPAGSGFTETIRGRDHWRPYTEPPRPEDPAGSLGRLVEDTISGKRDAIALPWQQTHALTLALIVGTVTIFCGGPGGSKSFAMLQLMAYLLGCGVRCAIFELEESREFHLLRVLAQLSGLADITTPDWVKENPEAVRDALQANRAMITAMGRAMWACPDSQLTLDQLAEWTKKRAAEGCRVIIIDPVTAAAGTDKPWIADNAFLQAVKRTATEYGCSVVIVSHPQKTVSLPDMNQLAGGAAYGRFAQTILWLEAHDYREGRIKTLMGTIEDQHNRTLHLLKTRNSRGQGLRMAFDFDARNLTLRELGLVLKGKKRKKTLSVDDGENI